jgi:hypothetical protein
MFLTEVYTEGLFLGLSFGALALARRQRWLLAALLAACAVVDACGGPAAAAAAGVDVVAARPRAGLARFARARENLRPLGTGLLVASPLLAYACGTWHWARRSTWVESRFFSRGLLLVTQSAGVWAQAASRCGMGPLQTSGVLRGRIWRAGVCAAGVRMWLRREPVLAVYSLLTIAFCAERAAWRRGCTATCWPPRSSLCWRRAGASTKRSNRAWTLGNVLLLACLRRCLALISGGIKLCLKKENRA